MGVGHGRAVPGGVWSDGEPAAGDERGRSGGEREHAVVDGCCACERGEDHQCGLDGIRQRDDDGEGAGYVGDYGVSAWGRIKLRADDMGVRHVCGVSGEVRDAWEPADDVERRTARWQREPFVLD